MNCRDQIEYEIMYLVYKSKLQFNAHCVTCVYMYTSLSAIIIDLILVIGQTGMFSAKAIRVL